METSGIVHFLVIFGSVLVVLALALLTRFFSRTVREEDEARDEEKRRQADLAALEEIRRQDRIRASRQLQVFEFDRESSDQAGAPVYHALTLQQEAERERLLKKSN